MDDLTWFDTYTQLLRTRPLESYASAGSGMLTVTVRVAGGGRFARNAFSGSSSSFFTVLHARDSIPLVRCTPVGAGALSMAGICVCVYFAQQPERAEAKLVDSVRGGQAPRTIRDQHQARRRPHLGRGE